MFEDSKAAEWNRQGQKLRDEIVQAAIRVTDVRAPSPNDPPCLSRIYKLVGELMRHSGRGPRLCRKCGATHMDRTCPRCPPEGAVR
jgi:hypothetical protein